MTFLPLVDWEYKNGHHNARYATPTHIRYRGAIRRVYGVLRATHGGHRHFILRYRRWRQPKDAASVPWGRRGQAHVVALLVRADHCQPLRRTERRGRPKVAT